MNAMQCRMARAGLKIGVRDLAVLAHVSPNTIARLERGERMHRETIDAVREALEAAGVVFFSSSDGAMGVAISRKELLHENPREQSSQP